MFSWSVLADESLSASPVIGEVKKESLSNTTVIQRVGPAAEIRAEVPAHNTQGTITFQPQRQEPAPIEQGYGRRHGSGEWQ